MDGMGFAKDLHYLCTPCLDFLYVMISGRSESFNGPKLKPDETKKPIFR